MNKLKNIFQLIRIRNSPSLLTHIILGYAISYYNSMSTININHESLLLFLLLYAAIMLMYSGGMAMNDLIDIKKDKKTNRPLITKKITITEGISIASVCFVISLIIFYFLNTLFWGILLLLTIFIYNFIHQSLPYISAIFMGLARSIVLPLSVTSFTGSLEDLIIIKPFIFIFLWTFLITVIAVTKQSNIAVRNFITIHRWKLIFVFLILLISMYDDIYLLTTVPLILFLCISRYLNTNFKNNTDKINNTLLVMLASFPLIDIALLGFIEADIFFILLCLPPFFIIKLLQKHQKEI